MKRSIFCLSLSILLLIQAGFAQEIVKTSSGADDKIRGYLIGPGDIIEGKVLGEDQFNFTARIDENGRFEVPFVNEPIMAKCRTEGEVRATVKKHLSKYLRTPLVSVQIKERRKPIPVTVYGEVRTPSQVELRRKDPTLMELLAAVSGVTEDAGGVVRIYRPYLPMCAESDREANWNAESNDGVEVPSRLYSLSSIQKGGKKSNPIIYPGDVIFVDKASPVYINGEVNRPQGIYIKERGLSLSQALGMVGGPRDRAKLKDVKIYRLKPNSQDRRVISVNLLAIQKGEAKDMMLEPYDVIDFEKKKKNIGEIILDTLVKTGTGAISGIGYGLPNRVLY
ncbi:MAG: hypothetical protein HKN25_17630 [Pyrinomonadaceae bacterium]|nr:hypothetical protein [Pyrinomonadaceae bacterium]